MLGERREAGVAAAQRPRGEAKRSPRDLPKRCALRAASNGLRRINPKRVYASPVCSGEVGGRAFRYGCEAKSVTARRGSLALDSDPYPKTDAHAPRFHYDREVDEKRTTESADRLIDDRVDNAEPSISIEPPRVYVAACGTLCDIFWWARRTPEPPK